MTDPRKLIDSVETAHALLEACHRRLDEAAAGLPDRDPADPAGREEIGRVLARCLGVRDAWIPGLDVRPMRSASADGLTVQWLAGASWPGVYATALWYEPDSPAPPDEPRPFVLLCCGHGQHGKLNPGYQTMARHLARRGACVLCPDNLGQGEREPMGHRDVVGPFAAGLSLQGLIVMETLGWLRWAKVRAGVDARRMAAIGNSGGGTLTQMLIPFAHDLAAMCSTGYPSTFRYIARKEKKHCHCNILPGVCRQLEMDHVYGCFAPRPLLLGQGRDDHLFPEDLFHLTSQRVRRWYDRADAGHRLATRVLPGGHSWDKHRIEWIGSFLAEHLGLGPAGDPPTESLLPADEGCYDSWPTDALDVDALTNQLTGADFPDGLRLWDVFELNGAADALPTVTDRGETRQIAAQIEAFLSGPREPSVT